MAVSKFKRGWCRKLVYLVVLVLLMHVLVTVFREKDTRKTASTSIAPDNKVESEPDFIDTDSDKDLVNAEELSQNKPEHVEETSQKADKQSEEPSEVEEPVAEHQSDTPVIEKQEEPKINDKPSEVPKPAEKQSEENGEKQSGKKQPELFNKKMKEERIAEEAILNKMKSNMLKENVEDSLSSLIKPKDILKEAVGPIRYKEQKTTGGSLDGVKLIVIARERSGFSVLRQFLNEDSGFFQHGEPNQDLNTVVNLLNCVLEPSIVQNFQLETSGEFGKTPYFQECLLDSSVICSDPLSYENTCSRHLHQILRIKNPSLPLIEQLMKENKDIKIVFLVRDPRGTFKDKIGPEMKPFCQKLRSDLEKSFELQRSYPGQFRVSRFEVLAREPRTETVNLLQSLGIQDLVDIKNITQDTSSEGWSLDRNPVSQINSWKHQLNIKQITKIESQCLETLSKLEYPILGI